MRQCEYVGGVELGERNVSIDNIDLLAEVLVFIGFPYNVRLDGRATGNGSTRHREFAITSGEMSLVEFTYYLDRWAAAGFIDHLNKVSFKPAAAHKQNAKAAPI